MSESLVKQTADAWEARGALFAVHFTHIKDTSLQFVHGFYTDDDLLSAKRLWKRRGYSATHVYVFGV